MAFIYKERWTPRANYELEKVIEYLLKEWSEKVAFNFHTKLQKRVFLLLRNPRLSKTSDNINFQIPITRHVTLFYRLKGKNMEIISLFDTRQHPKKLKL